jgi:hypothetical protein
LQAGTVEVEFDHLVLDGDQKSSLVRRETLDSVAIRQNVAVQGVRRRNRGWRKPFWDPDSDRRLDRTPRAQECGQREVFVAEDGDRPVRRRDELRSIGRTGQQRFDVRAFEQNDVPDACGTA